MQWNCTALVEYLATTIRVKLTVPVRNIRICQLVANCYPVPL